MQKILIAITLLASTLCFANDIATQFSNGFQGIRWKDRSATAKALLTQKGIEFEESTSKYSADDLYISFKEGESETKLKFYKDMFASVERNYKFEDPDNHSQKWWQENLSVATKSISGDNEHLGISFSPSSINIRGLGDTKTTVLVSMSVYYKPMAELRGADSKKKAELKKKKEQALVNDIVSKLINPN